MICLNKFIAQAGVCSRRKATDLIKQGHVTINGVCTKEPYTKVTEQDTITVHNKIIKLEKKIYILLNKPKNSISAVTDINNRRTVIDLLPKNIQERLYPVGRLDRDTTGLLLLTNDGDFAQQLAHPKFNVTKVYKVTTNRNITKKDVFTLLRGVQLEDGFMKADEIFYPSKHKNIISVAIHSGKNHIVKRLFKHLNYKVIKLDRTHYGCLNKKNLPIGTWRYLQEDEKKELLS